MTTFADKFPSFVVERRLENVLPLKKMYNLKPIFMKRHFKPSWIVALAFIAVAMVSCYKFGRIFAPKEVAPNTPYQGRIVCINENNNGEQTGFSVFAVRVPRNWEVTVGDSAYQQ